MNLPEISNQIFEEIDVLQKKAYQVIFDLCNSYENEFGFISTICIDLDFGFVGVKPCNLKGIYVRNNQVLIEAIDIDTCEEKDILLHVSQSIEVLEILKDASFSEEQTFFNKFPNFYSVKTDTDIEKVWIMLADVPINKYDEIERDFLYWEAGTDRQEIWGWFDKKHSKGIGFLNGIA